ncbi:putative disease resistance RPP13-like protein 1 [Rutidosis leptorrhynchoides]|uniref:putative disease resistance RPP13-like protein 1 n=1 Tax=Rutidosis leptorrhynchoides TaxID=125765 RepID=UPI003A9A1CC6
MADALVSEPLKFVLEKLTSEAVKKIGRSRGIQSELKKFETKFSEIKDLLNDASEKEINDNEVKRWLNRLQHVAYDMEDVLDGLATEAMHREFNDKSVGCTSKVKIPTCFTNFSLSTRLSSKLDQIYKELKDLETEKTSLGLIPKVASPKNKNTRIETTSIIDVSTIVGREVKKGELLQQLLTVEPGNKSFSVIPIVGMGGVGKTTLAKLLYNDKQVKEHFELKAWVCVSDEFDITRISTIIYQNMGGENKDFRDLNLLHVALEKQLTGKRFLIVLDDVWSENLGTLVALFHKCAPGSKIIVTTRKKKLLNQLGYSDTTGQLESLSHDDAVTLFAQNALGKNNFDSHPNLKPHGEGIVEKCGRLPLALIAIGRLLRTSSENEEEYWKKVLDSNIWTLENAGEIVPALRLSYQDLSACLKRLFAYCSFFPKDYIFDKGELVLLWMAEGFLHHSTVETDEHFGHQCFSEMLSRSFFQHAPNDTSLFVMHDLMNDLATSIAGDFFVRLDNGTEKYKGSEALEKCRHMSFVRETYGAYDKFKAFKSARSLRTILATSVGVIEEWQCFYLSNKILVDIFLMLPLLRVLNLSNFAINEIPDTIGSLRHLRYLNLSRTWIKQLPESVCNLYNLQTLILFGCDRLVELPKDFSMLKNLRHFDIRQTSSLELNSMPLGIGKLKSLQTLSKIIIGGENRFEIRELKELKNLCGDICIEGLEKVTNATDARDANFSQKRLNELKLIWSDVVDDSRKDFHDKDVLDGMKPHSGTLKQLKIMSYRGAELPNWVVDPNFNKLSEVSLHGCKNCTCLPPLGQLPSLEKLFIEGLDGVNNVGLEFTGNNTGVVSFPSLKILSFENMEGWKLWSTNCCGNVFPCLEKLVIKKCPNLVEVSIDALPSLRHLVISKCEHNVLTSLVCAASSVTELILDRISGHTDEVFMRRFGDHLREVEDLIISACDGIRYLWESEAKASVVLASLRKLEVYKCDDLISLGERGEEEDDDDKSGNNHLASLRKLNIEECKSIERCSCPNNIETLIIWRCDSITNVSFSSGGGQKLKSLHIQGCNRKVMKNELGGGYEGVGDKTQMLINKNNNTGMPSLESLYIRDVPHQKIIVELNCFLHITNLIISDCESLESIPVVQLPKLIFLTNLVICKCPSLGGSFPGGLWPPKLKNLTIGKLKKPISEWGPQEFPPSLVELTLCGGGSSGNEDDASIIISDDHLYCLLPSSLTSLHIIDLKEMETISKGLQHLTSLQHLEIKDCPKMKHILFPSSLTSLVIWKMKELETISRGLQHLTSLQHLSIADCPKMKDLLLPTSLTSLSIYNLNELETISKGPQHLTSLQHLDIHNCPKMKDLPEMSFPSLLSLTIDECPKLEKMCSKSKNKSRRGSYNYYWPLISHIPSIGIYSE